MAQAIAINFTPNTSAPREPTAAPTPPTGKLTSRSTIAAGSSASDTATPAIPSMASAETRLDASSSAPTGWTAVS